MAEPHIGELAELHALGLLDEDERAQVEAHVAGCAVCRRRVGEAEETILALESGVTAQTPPRMRELHLTAPHQSRVPRLVQLGAALAAGLVLGVLSMFAASRHAQDLQPALVAMVQSHFEHAQFAPVGTGAAPSAKAIYARNRSWVFVIARGSDTYDVYAVGALSARKLGQLHPSGSASTLFVNTRVPEPLIELREGARVIERAAIR
jgi:Putative zinc-finger